MTITLIYKPDIGIVINGAELNWSIKRETARQLLDNKHKADDRIISLGESNIVQRRDIYENYKSEYNFFFLNYNADNLLSWVDVHAGLEIVVDNVVLLFDKELTLIKQELESVSPSVIELAEGEYFFKDLKMTISDSNAMGGDGSELSYFYCSVNVDHLLE